MIPLGPVDLSAEVGILVLQFPILVDVEDGDGIAESAATPRHLAVIGPQFCVFATTKDALRGQAGRHDDCLFKDIEDVPCLDREIKITLRKSYSAFSCAFI